MCRENLLHLVFAKDVKNGVGRSVCEVCSIIDLAAVKDVVGMKTRNLIRAFETLGYEPIAGCSQYIEIVFKALQAFWVDEQCRAGFAIVIEVSKLGDNIVK